MADGLINLAEDIIVVGLASEVLGKTMKKFNKSKSKSKSKEIKWDD
jgi:hypothetical protein